MGTNRIKSHLDEVGESYGEHFANASGFGVRMIVGGLACLVHAVCPFLCQKTGSETIRSLHRRMTPRADKPNWERHPII
jgi:hypothetical protein